MGEQKKNKKGIFRTIRENHKLVKQLKRQKKEIDKTRVFEKNNPELVEEIVYELRLEDPHMSKHELRRRTLQEIDKHKKDIAQMKRDEARRAKHAKIILEQDNEKAAKKAKKAKKKNK